MKMCIVITFPLSLGAQGGGTRHCMEIASHLGMAGVEVILMPVSTNSYNQFPRAQPSKTLMGHRQAEFLKANSVQVIEVPPNPISWRLDGLSIKKAVQNVLAQKRVDAVLGWFHEVAFLPSVLRAQKVIFGMIAAASYSHFLSRDMRLPHWMGRIIDERLIARPLRQADVIFATSNFTRKEIIDRFGVTDRQVDVAYCAVDAMFAHIPRLSSTGISRLIYYSCLTHSKGIFDAIDALGRVAAQGWRDWTFKIIGEGDEAQVRQAAWKHGIGDQVVLLGHVEHPALVRELEWAQVAILPSHTESFGLAIAEAQAAGLPVIAYEVGAVPEVVEKNVTGWLVPKGSVDLLAQAIMKAMREPEQTYRAGLAGRERIIRLFSWQRTAMEMLHRIEEIKVGKVSC